MVVPLILMMMHASPYINLINQRYCPGKHSLKFRTFTVTLTTAKQPFHKTVNMYSQTKLVTKKISNSEHTIEIDMISLYEPKFSYCDLDLEDSNPVFTHDTLAYNGVSPYWVWLQMGYSDFDLEDSNPV